jgi:hypothetical protein
LVITAAQRAEDDMRLTTLIAMATITPALFLTACGGPDVASAPAAGTPALAGDEALIATATKVSDAIGGCVRPVDAEVESKVVSLENGSIVMVACSQGVGSYTHRLFAVRGSEAPQLLTLPDYDATGWFASDKASTAELDAGTGVLTTARESADKSGCGSEGRYQWDGIHFVLQELRWQECGDPNLKGPPFPVIWPTQQGASTAPNTATPAP